MAVPRRDTPMDLRRPRCTALLALATLLGAYALAPRASGQEYVPTADPSHPRVRYADSLVSLNDRCPVRGGKLSPSYKPVYVNGHPIGFCWMSCPGVFVQDPERYLRAMGVRPPGIFRPSVRPAVDSSLRRQVNFEIFFFASRAEMQRFLKDPLRYCGLLTDPITMERFRPTPKSPRAEYGGRWYYFTSDSTRTRFLENPVLHKDRRTGTS